MVSCMLATRIRHSDKTGRNSAREDKLLCLVLAVGRFTGGGLVMKEQGLVLDLEHGDFAVFASGDTTHFNLNYVGERVSLVLHTDGGFDRWENGQNGWGKHPFFH